MRRDDRERRDELRRLRAALEVARPGELLFVGLNAPGARVRLPQHLEDQGLARPRRYLSRTEVAAVAGVAFLTGVVPIDAIHRYLKAGMVHPVPRWAWNLGGGQRGGRHKERADQVLTPSRGGG